MAMEVGLSIGSTGIAMAIPAQLPIPAELNTLDSAIANLDVILCQLGDRLDPVLSPTHGKEPLPMQPEKQLCAQADLIRSLRQRVECMASNVQFLLERLEL